MRIYLNGFMGSGKSTVGPLLAEQLDWSFVDLDANIESAIDMPIAAFFSSQGEPAFRAVEQKQLFKTTASDASVIAVGGGALCTQDNLEFALNSGVVVFLSVAVPELVRRLKAEQATRPMLLSDDGELLPDATVRDRIELLLNRRLGFYNQAHLTVATDGRTPQAIAMEIAGLLADEHR
ncbi:MAG: shikimate kinase [Bacteroidota bacterium]